MDRGLKEVLYILFSLGISPSRYIEIFRKKGNCPEEANRYFFNGHNRPLQLRLGEEATTGGPGKGIYWNIIKSIEKKMFKAVHIGGKGYPAGLENIYLPPPVLFYRGNKSLEGFNIAVVGSRKCTKYGSEAAAYISKNLSSMGITVVSGLALGIDSVAHKNAVSGKGGSIAVLGSGLDVIYPPENKKLYSEILENGAAITEFPPGMPPLRQNFPIRNRIISGISRGVVIVEAGSRSGAMITGETALEQDREVFAVPGSIFSNCSRGCHRLIKSGAKLVGSTDDILEEFQGLTGYRNDRDRIEAAKTRNKAADAVSGKADRVYQHIGYSPVSLERIKGLCGIPVNDILNALTVLEMEGLVEEGPSNHYRRCD